MPVRSVVLILISGLLLNSCRGLDHPTSLDSTSWELYTSRMTSRPITLIFANGQVRGSAGCNSYSGEYRVNGDRIVFEDLYTTMMACLEPEGVMEREQHFLQFLTEVERFLVSDGQLQLLRPDGEARLFISKDLTE